ncbi:MAG: proline--tRNA ligase [Candidatus Marsarchaeota archaeon]|nr:proline--tRNA ligase [Candidatus Marsarchaeota archaeon]MCL5111673.1 proline--tRNA ligase [Candidatus Marsarchaeota archaeon]
MADKNEKGSKDGITVKKEENFSEWYTQVISKSEFVDYTAVSGALAFRPDGYFVWETIQRAMDEMFKAIGIMNVYFPLFIPEKLLNKEKEHVEGFNPEVAWVTHTGSSKLDERLAVRPTSETIMYESYSKWIRSWRDLPMRYNQWNSVVRWEFKHPTPLLRSREFLWNEGHTAFATKAEADAECNVILGIYNKVLREYLALPGITGRKSDAEKFAGAEATNSIEHMLPDGASVQGPDFHSDGQRFAKAFDIKFLNKDGKTEYVFQNTFGFSTRELGVMLAVHGDDKGLVIPPKLARIQVVIVPIYNNDTKGIVIKAAHDLSARIAHTARTFVDDNDAYSPGWKFHEWELKGVPIRIEIGERDIKADKVVVYRRDTYKKQDVKMKELPKEIEALLAGVHESIYKKAMKALEASIHEVNTYSELKKVVGGIGGFAQAPWCGSPKCEAKVKSETKAKITNMPFDAQAKARGKKCVVCSEDAKHIANFAKSY